MATATQDEELLIIQDESDSSDDSATFNFNFTDDETKDSSVIIEDSVDFTTSGDDGMKIESEDKSNESDSLEIIHSQADVQDNKTDTVNQDLTIQDIDGEIRKSSEEAAQVEKSEDISFDISLGDETTSTTELPLTETVNSTSGDENTDTFNILDTASQDTQNNGVSNEVSDAGNLNQILTATITQLQSRKKAIGDDTSAKEQKAQELKKQIGELEAQVAEIEADITSLGLEAEKIDSNITKLEDMKLDPVKEHNTKRVAKK